jgi:hypothetical protein
VNYVCKHCGTQLEPTCELRYVDLTVDGNGGPLTLQQRYRCPLPSHKGCRRARWMPVPLVSTEEALNEEYR